MTDTIVEITDRARGILAFDAEITAISERIDAEIQRHAKAVAEEAARYEHKIDALNKLRNAIEKSIYQLGEMR
jgi:uncharacterized protein involved in exopolysaccharide biosynthesis